MKKNILIIILLIGISAILIAGAWLIYADNNFNQQGAKETPSAQEQERAEVSLSIDAGQVLKSEFIKGMTAFDLLKIKAEETGLSLKTKTYDIGIMIESIGDKENGKDGKYWLYYINGEMAQVSADKKELNPGDKVEFKFEKSPF